MRMMRRGDIYYARLPYKGNNSIQQGDRPVIVLQNDIINRFSPNVMVAVITSKVKRLDLESHVILPEMKGLPRRSMVLVEQCFSLPKSFLYDFRCTADEETLKKIDRAIRFCFIRNERTYRWKRRRGNKK